MIDFSKKTQTIAYFESLLKDLCKSRVTAVFSFSPLGWNESSGYRIYDTNSEIYILLENEFCLVIRYHYIDELNIQFRKMTDLEKEEYHKLREKDWFNTECELRYYTNEPALITTCSLEYGSIVDISLRSVTRDYSKWLEDGIDFVQPLDETFDEIKFAMSNGKSLVVCADEAESNGRTLFWSKDADDFEIRFHHHIL